MTAKPGLLAFGRGVIAGFVKHDVMSLSAAVAFYTGLSFAPLVLLLVTIGGFLGDATQNELIRFFDQQLGPSAGDVTQAVIDNAQQSQAKAEGWRWLLGTSLLVLSASAIFGQLQSSLNIIWETQGKASSGVLNWLRRRLISMGMVFAMLFILLVSLVVSSVIEHVVPTGQALVGRLVAFIGSFLVAALLFAAIFKVLPDRPIAWRDVWWGAGVTAGLFSVGKLAVSLYLEHGGVGESYGKAAGALIALLVWAYYSCTILFLGAEITRHYAQHRVARRERMGGPGPDVPHRRAGQGATG
ncbi:MAG: YihY/virulence factor BrkB family protein [Phycisphaerales bacterium]